MDEDEDSLFGTPSPPSSPRSGRSSSPALALPSSGSSTQNVGTIALPGSHPNSEHAINPALLMLNHPTPVQKPYQYVPRAPTRVPQATLSYAPSTISPYHRMPTQLGTQSIGNQPYCPTTRANLPEKERKQKKKPTPTATRASTPRAPPPPIRLPDPSAPVPPNFLRNQAALLGTAGLVSGVLPARLSVARHTRGKTSENPIVIDDENDPGLATNRSRVIPNISGIRSSSPNNPPTLTMYPLPEVDPAYLPQPTNAEIVAVLIKQKNIFPVLESILKLIAAGASTSSSGGDNTNPSSVSQVPLQKQSSSTLQNDPALGKPSVPTDAPPTKRRKLNRVPAGAADWDVPYPFQAGEGPKQYQDNWQKDRGKQLIAELVAIIKIAARKAATKRYWKEREALRTQLELREKNTAADGVNNWNVLINGHYRLSTAEYSGENTPSTVPSSPALVPAVALQEGTSPFDSLIASLLAAGTPASTATVPDPILSVTPDTIYNDWMSIFNSFSASEADTTNNEQKSYPADVFAQQASISSIMDMPVFGQGDIEIPPIPDTAVSDAHIDPMLLALSGQGDRERSMSTSVTTTPGPATPASASWEIGADVVNANTGNSDNMHSQGSGQLGGMAQAQQHPYNFAFAWSSGPANVAQKLLNQFNEAGYLKKPKARNIAREDCVVDETGTLRLSDVALPLPSATVYPTTSSSTGPRLLLSPPGGIINPTGSSSAPLRPARLRTTTREKPQTSKRSKKEVRALAMQKRVLLAAELERAAREYWEVQLEHSALVELAKDPAVVNNELGGRPAAEDERVPVDE